MPKEPQAIEATPLADVVDAVQSLPPDLALIKMENESIMALAAKHPRDPAKMLAILKAQLRAYPALARDAMYTKPVGKEPGSNRQKYATGLSIRAAETLSAVYGFNAVRDDTSLTDDPDKVRVSATFVDYQTGRVWQSCGILSKMYKDRKGNLRKHGDDRFFNVVVKAEASKRIREVIVRTIDAGLKAEFEQEINDVLADVLDDATVTKIVKSFASKGVRQGDLERAIGKPLKDCLQADRVQMQQMWTALKTGESTVAEMFHGGAADLNGAPDGVKQSFGDGFGKEPMEIADGIPEAVTMTTTTTTPPPDIVNDSTQEKLNG